jgi:hypothetical protein
MLWSALFHTEYLSVMSVGAAVALTVIEHHIGGHPNSENGWIAIHDIELPHGYTVKQFRSHLKELKSRGWVTENRGWVGVNHVEIQTAADIAMGFDGGPLGHEEDAS